MKKRIIISLIIFIIWTILVCTNNINWFNDSVYDFLYSLKSNTFTNIMKIFTFFANTKAIVFLSLLSLLGLFFKTKKPLYLVGTIIVSTILNNVLKIIFRVNRPEHYRFITAGGFSYPSGHAMASMTFYGFFIIFVINSNLDKKYKYILSIIIFIFILFIGLSRIYLGVHYPSDIIGGWLISFILLNIANELVKKEGF